MLSSHNWDLVLLRSDRHTYCGAGSSNSLYTEQHSAIVYYSTVVLSRCRAIMSDQDALLKPLLRSERTTGAWVIVNHHSYPLDTRSGALDHGNTMEIPWKYYWNTMEVPWNYRKHYRNYYRKYYRNTIEIL